MKHLFFSALFRLYTCAAPAIHRWHSDARLRHTVGQVAITTAAIVLLLARRA